jgi:addiction module HigA family antidote
MKDTKPAESPIREAEWSEPIHPGEIIRRRFFAPMNLSQAAFCKQFHIDPSKLSRILNGTMRISPETANEFSDAFGMSPMFFLNLQSQHELAMLGKKL